METDDRRDPINSLDLADLEERRMARPTYKSGSDKQSPAAKSEAMPGSRRLLARLRDVMAGSGSPQERLDNIVTTIAMDFVAEVCSVYVLRAGEVLELFAATGLSGGNPHNPALNR